MSDVEIGYYCPNCNKVYPSCWEFDNELICSTCFDEDDIKIITIDNFRKNLKHIPLISNALEHFKEIVKKDSRNIRKPRFTETEREKMISILNAGLREEKLKQISKNIKNDL